MIFSNTSMEAIKLEEFLASVTRCMNSNYVLLPLRPAINTALLVEQIVRLGWYCSAWPIPSDEPSGFWVKDKI